VRKSFYSSFSCPLISQSSSLKQFVVARIAFLALLLLCATDAVAAALLLLLLPLLPRHFTLVGSRRRWQN